MTIGVARFMVGSGQCLCSTSVRGEGGLGAGVVTVHGQRVLLRTLSQECDQLRVGHVAQVDTIAGQQLVTRSDPTIRYGRLLHQSLDGVLQHSVICLTESEAKTAINLAQCYRELSIERRVTVL